MRRTYTVVLLILMTALWIYADVYYAVQPVDDIKLIGDVWNLHDVEPHGAEFNYRLEKSESTCRLWSPTQRYDLLGNRESVLLNCTETRKYKLFLSPAIPIRKSVALVNAVDSFSVKGRIQQSEFVIGNGVSMTETSRQGYCKVLTDEAYVEAVLLHDRQLFDWYVSTDSLLSISSVSNDEVMTTTVDSYRIMVDGEDFPRAFKRITTTECLGRQIYADSIAWVYELPYINSNSATRKSKIKITDKSLDKSGGIEPEESTIQVRHEGQTLYLTSNTTGTGHLLVCDAMGRVYIEAEINLSEGNFQMPLQHLPMGEYIVSISDDAQREIYATKILTNN